MFFSYLFYFQSKKESRLEQVNRKWSEINASAKLPDKSTTDRDESTTRQQNGLDGENLLGEISSLNDHKSVDGARHSKTEVFDEERDCPKAKS